MAVLIANRRSARERRAVSIALAMIVGVMSMPVVYGIVFLDARCAITLDICHPLQSVDSSAPTLLAPPTPGVRIAGAHPQWRESVDLAASEPLSRLAEAPDPPPPKARA